MMTDYKIVFDGGSLGNPGEGYGSFLIEGRDGDKELRRIQFGDLVTNNQAEYGTLIASLEYLLDIIEKDWYAVAGTYSFEEWVGGLTVEVRGDSALVIHQVEGQWKTKEPHLVPLRDKVRELISKFEYVTFVWQSRELSEEILGH